MATVMRGFIHFQNGRTSNERSRVACYQIVIARRMQSTRSEPHTYSEYVTESFGAALFGLLLMLGNTLHRMKKKNVSQMGVSRNENNVYVLMKSARQVRPALQAPDEVHKKCTGCFILTTLRAVCFHAGKQEENFNSALFKE